MTDELERAVAAVDGFVQRWESRIGTGAQTGDTIYCVTVNGFEGEAELCASDLRIILAANRKMAEALAASPSVGGWDERLSIITEALKTKLTEAKINCDGSDEMVAYTQGVIDTYEFCREAVSAPPPVSVGGWEDISTAPKDGTLVDLWASYGERVAGAKWTNGVWREWALDGFDSMGWVRLEGTATHWMPLPPPPSTGSRPQEAILPQTEKGS